MNPLIPPHHQIVLDNLSKGQQVGGRKAIHDLYIACANAFVGNTTNFTNRSHWGINTDTVKISVMTDKTTGIYVQLSQAKGSEHVLLTVGKKIAVETSDPVTSSRNTQVFI